MAGARRVTGYRVVALTCDRRPGGELCPTKLVTTRSTMEAAREDASLAGWISQASPIGVADYCPEHVPTSR